MRGEQKIGEGGIIVLAALALWLFFLLSLTPAMLQYLFNADSGYLPVFVADLLHTPRAIASWHLPGAPFFFPDIFLFLIMSILAPSYPWAMYLSCLALATIFCGLAFALLPQRSRLLRLGLVLLPLCCELSGLQSGGSIAFRAILIPAYHGGALLGALLCLVLAGKLLEKSSPKLSTLLAVTIVFTIVSDRSLATLFCLPAFGVLGLQAHLGTSPGERRKIWLLALTIAFATAIGLALFKLLDAFMFIAALPRTLPWSKALRPAVNMLWRDIASHQHVLLVLVVAIPIVAAQIINFFSRMFRQEKSAADPERFIDDVLAFGFTAHFGALLLLAFYQPGAMRYVGVGAYLGVILLARSVSLPRPRLIAASLILAFLAFIAATRLDLRVSRLNYYPSLVRCLDGNASQFSSRRGAAEYWFAKSSTTLSRAVASAKEHRWGGQRVLNP